MGPLLKTFLDIKRTIFARRRISKAVYKDQTKLLRIQIKSVKI